MKNSKALFQFIPYMKEAKRDYILGFITAIFGVGGSVIAVYLLSKVFDNVEGSTSEQIFKRAVIIALGYGVVLIFSGFMTYIRNIYLVKGANNVYVSIQTKIYDHIQNLPIKYFDNMPAGSVVSRITSDANVIRTFFVNTFVNIVVIVLKLVFIYGVLFSVNLLFGLVMLLIIPLMYFIMYMYNKLNTNNVLKYRKANTQCSAAINEGYQNLEVIKAFNKEQESIDYWKSFNDERYKYGSKINVLDSTMLHTFTGFLNVIFFAGIIFYYSYSHFNDNKYGVTIGMVYLFINYTQDIIYRITDLTMEISLYTRAVGAAVNIQEVLDLQVEEDTAKISSKENFLGNIKFENVYFAYKEDNYVLKNINLDIKENQTVAFVGSTGSGKSTVMNLLIKFYEADKGTVYVSGEDIKNYNRAYLRENVSIVLQDSFLFEGSLLENIEPNGNRELALSALERVGGSFILEQGRTLDSKVEVGGSNFSTGEKQLICLARALAKNPKILILDESTANVDSETEQYVSKAVEELKHGRTTLIIAHRLSTIKNADCIYVLHRGELVESGNHQQLIALNGRYKKMYETQVGRVD
ncbi:ABC transporter ATP-binding protein [Gemelliphila palaticanis]|uniref:ABC transporter ATP-binding protein n=1 Tax=Gemelliphila palaticanis TaxID=81950 RepID=A0ABX2SZX6_9BACL|nr:ABC transporter ATP-binding protein [Gemella palaticanis]MBF0715939.1 ABC transporter ATP-binding protein [Gemella palaticanis]NYS47869.1 ABC transporter ATP-binding protein [Gemella palaticanis]